MPLDPVTLVGEVARLEPLALVHAGDLSRYTGEMEMWRYTAFGSLAAREDLEAFIGSFQDEPIRGTGLPFAIIDIASNRAIGSTSLWDISMEHRRGEIGRTWIGAPYRRTAINTECKYLILRHAFETLGLLRVQLKTDTRNERSARAIERLGAIREGVLRSHMTLWDGSRRDSVVFSILAEEWPGVQARLEGLLGRS